MSAIEARLYMVAMVGWVISILGYLGLLTLIFLTINGLAG